MTLRCRQHELFLQSLQRGGLRNRVRHIEIGGHPARCCRTTLGVDIGLGRESRLTEMDMIVDHTGHNETSRSIDHVVERCFGNCMSLNNTGYPLILYD